MSDLHWVPTADESTDEEMAERGLRRVRSLYQMRRPLPLEPDLVATTRRIDLRAFRVGEDDHDFLRVNNRAFSWHPEQGGWTEEKLVATMAEEWFDAEGFLVHETTAPTPDPSTADEDHVAGPGELDGFCWTKIHPADGSDPAMGEIFVIAADPSTHGTGLGRALTVGGLQYLSERGLRVGMLYVEHDNDPAVSLYEKLGFTVHHVHAAYAPDTTDVPPTDHVAAHGGRPVIMRERTVETFDLRSGHLGLG